MIRLAFKSSGVADQTCELPDGKFSVGRSVSNALRIQDESVSGQHCELLVNGSELIVRDSGSRNGTYVDGVRVEGQRGVRSGQVIRFGGVNALVSIERPWELGVDDVSTVQGLLRVPSSKREEQREWVVTASPTPADERPNQQQ